MSISFTHPASGSPPTLERVEEFERAHGISFPSDFRDFLLHHTGGRLVQNWSAFGSSGDFVAVVFGLFDSPEHESLEYAVREFGHDLDQFLPIAIGNGGSYFLLRASDEDRGSVWYWDHELEDSDPPTFHEITRIADSFTEWSLALREPS